MKRESMRKQDIVLECIAKHPGITTRELNRILAFPVASIMSHLIANDMVKTEGTRCKYRYSVNPKPRKVIRHSAPAKDVRWGFVSPDFVEKSRLYDRLHCDFVRTAA